MTPRSFAEARQAQGMTLTETEDSTASAVKEMDCEAVKRYKSLSMLAHIEAPERSLRTAMNQPSIVVKSIRSLYSDRVR